MGTEFTPIFLFILVGILTAVGMLSVSAVFSPGRGRETMVKQMPYESGMDPIGDARQRFDVRYYLIAIAFLLFDVELMYLYPWAVAQWSVVDPPASAGLNDPAVEVGSPAFRSVADFRRPASQPAGVDLANVTRQAEDGAQMAALLGIGIRPEFRSVVFGEILVFIAVLAAAFAYAWRKGVFEWR